MKLGIDIGGTFTDFVLYSPEQKGIFFAKTLTTYPDPTDGIFYGLAEIKKQFNCSVHELDMIVHGTTLVTNAIIERKGAKTAFITTKGFEDVLEIGREMRYDIYDLFLTMPKPLVQRNLRYGITERVGTNGDIITALNKKELENLGSLIKAENIESIGVCLLNSFANTKHEKEIGDFLSANFPDLSYSLSTEIMPEIREYERSSATAMNAYVQPITDQYLNRLKKRLADDGFDGKLNIMISSGRLTTIEEAIKSPIHLLESGPAGGSMAGVFFSKLFNEKNLLCFDMGGTTAKASLIYKGAPEITNHFEAARVKRFKKGSGLPVRIPVIDMIEIGAGGGSIARVNTLGLLTVGPDSASSAPGPACYNLGGNEPTVTDADLVLGYLNEDYFLGGTMKLSKEKASEAIDKHIASKLNISVEAAAMGIHKIVNENMANAARVHILEKGMDPRHFSMIGFGGAGPVHAFGVAKLINAPSLYIPVGAGVTSALGFLVSPVAYEKIHSHISVLKAMDWGQVNTFLNTMEGEGMAFLKKSSDNLDHIEVERVVEMRYEGQGHEITIKLPSGKLTNENISEIQKRFKREYEFRYNRSIGNVEMQCVTWRVLVKGVIPTIDLIQKDIKTVLSDPYKGDRKVFFEETGFINCPVYDRYSFTKNEIISGPMIIEEKESTTVIGINSEVLIDTSGNIKISIK